MSAENTPGKLTPASPNGYDGYRDMDENHEAEESRHEEEERKKEIPVVAQDTGDGDDDEEDDEEGEEGKIKKEKKKKETEYKKTKKSAGEILLKIILPDTHAKPSRSVRTDEVRAGLISSIVENVRSRNAPRKEDTVESAITEEQKDELIELVDIFYPRSDDELDAQTRTEASAAKKISKELLEAMGEAGFNAEEITDRLDARQKEKTEAEEQSRAEQIQEYFENFIDTSSSYAFFKLRQNLIDMLGNVDASSPFKKQLENLKPMLDEILKYKEVEKAYAFAMVNVVDAMEDWNPDQKLEKVERPVEEETYELTKEQKKELEIMMNILLVGKNREMLVSELLARWYPLEGEGETYGRNKAIRQEILNLAAKAGLDATKIEVEELTHETDIVKVSELEEVYESNSFEAIIERQIIEATPDEVEDIKKQWKALLETANPENTELITYAEDAIKILDVIIHFKNEQIREHARGGKVNPTRVAKPYMPEYLQTDEEKEAESERLIKDEEKEKLAALFLKMLFTAKSATSQIDRRVATEVIDFILSNGNPDTRVATMTTLISWLSAVQTEQDKGQRAYLIAHIQNVSMNYGISPHELFIKQDVPPVPENIAREHAELFIKESLDNTTRAQLSGMHQKLNNTLSNNSLQADMKSYVTDSVEQIEKVLPQTASMSKEEAVELSKDAIKKLFVTNPELLKSHELEAVNALVLLALAPYQINEDTYEAQNAGDALGYVLNAFTDNTETGQTAEFSRRVRDIVIKRADELGLNMTVIMQKFSELSEQQEIDGVVNPFTTKEEKIAQIVSQSLNHEFITPEKLDDVLNAWDVILASTEKKPDELKELVHNVQTSLGALSGTTENPSTEIFNAEASAEQQLATAKRERFAKTVRELVADISENEVLQKGEAELAGTLLDIVSDSTSISKAKIAELVMVLGVQNEDISPVVARKVQKELLTRIKDMGISQNELMQEMSRIETVYTLDRLEQMIVESITNVSDNYDTRVTSSLRQFVETLDNENPLNENARKAMEEFASVVETRKTFAEQDSDTQNAQRDEKEELRILVEKVASSLNGTKADGQSLHDYLQSLQHKFDGEKLSLEDLEDELKKFDKHADAVVKTWKQNATEQEDKRALHNTGLEIINFENTANEIRKVLIQKIEMSKPKEKHDVSRLTAQSVKDVMAKSQKIIKSEAQITVSELNDYVRELKHVLKTPGSLTHEQLELAYRALHLQDSILRSEAGNNGTLFAYSKNFHDVQMVQAELYRALVNNFKGNAKDEESRILKQDDSKVREYLEDKDYTDVSLNMEFTPVNVGSDRMGNEYRISGESSILRDVGQRQAAALAGQGTGVALPTKHYDDQGRELPQPEQRTATMQRRIAALGDPEILGNEPTLNQLQEDLRKLISDAVRNDTSAGLTSLKELAEARNLVNIIHQQRSALNAKRHYEGKIERERKMDPKIYNGNVDEVLYERMRRIAAYYDPAARTADDFKEGNGTLKYGPQDIVNYYKELQRWAQIILNNDVRKNPDRARDPETLRLTNEQYAFYKNFVGWKININDVQSNPARIREELTKLNDRSNNYLRFFTNNVPDPNNPDKFLGVPYEQPLDKGAYSPESLRATMQEIADKFSKPGTDFHTGGNRELIDAEGKFQYHNFFYWIRSKINEDVDYNKDGQINPFGKIIIKLDMGQISMYELLLLIPEYTQQRNFEIYMNKGNPNETYSGWGQKTESPEFGWADMDYLAAEMEFRQMTHEIRMQFIPTSVSNDKKSYMELMKKLHHNNHWTRASNVFLMLGLAAGSRHDAKAEFDRWKGTDESQGSLGKAMSDMLVAYNYLADMTDYFETEKRDANGKIIKDKKTGKKQMREKTFNENIFYRFLEPNGANRFLVKMAEGALNYHTDAKAMYANFIGKRLEAAANEYLSLARNEQERDRIKQIMREWMPDANDISSDVNFTDNSNLFNFHTIVQRHVFNNYGENDLKQAQEIKLKVQNDLIRNLKREYFEELVNIEVADVHDAKGKVNKGSNRSLMSYGMKKFGDTIAYEKTVGGRKITVTIRDMLLGNARKHETGFNIDQIFKFDYSNDPNDLTYKNNPFRKYTNERDLRNAIDGFMDPKANRVNYELFKKNEQMMLAFTQNVTRIKRSDLNHFRDADELEFSRDIIKRAMKDFAQKTYGMDEVESDYGWWWVRDYVYLWGIGASLDVEGIGFRWDGKLIGTGKWRPRRQGKDGGGNPHTFDEFLALSLPFLQHVQCSNIKQDERWGHRSIFYWLQGGEGGYIKPRAIREFDKRSNYTFEQNAEALYVDNTLDASSELLDLLAKTEFDITQIVNFDMHGNVVYDYGKAREVFGKWRKAARYAFGKNGLDYRAKIWVDGREKTLYDHFFGEKTQALNAIIQREIPGRTVDFMYKDPADAIMMSIVAAEVYEHRKIFRSGHHWTIQNVMELEKFLLDFMTDYSGDTDEYGMPKSMPKRPSGLYSPKIFQAALRAYHTGYSKMFARELHHGFWESMFGGFGAGLKAFFTKGKWIY